MSFKGRQASVTKSTSRSGRESLKSSMSKKASSGAVALSRQSTSESDMGLTRLFSSSRSNSRSSLSSMPSSCSNLNPAVSTANTSKLSKTSSQNVSVSEIVRTNEPTKLSFSRKSSSKTSLDAMSSRPGGRVSLRQAASFNKIVTEIGVTSKDAVPSPTEQRTRLARQPTIDINDVTANNDINGTGVSNMDASEATCPRKRKSEENMSEDEEPKQPPMKRLRSAKKSGSLKSQLTKTTDNGDKGHDDGAAEALEDISSVGSGDDEDERDEGEMADDDHSDMDMDAPDAVGGPESEDEGSAGVHTSPVPHPPPVPMATGAFGGPPPIEIMISFDTTGSMSSYLDEVKASVNDIIQRLFSDIPSLKIGVLVHGDYCDESTFYLMKKIDFTNDVNALCQFVTHSDGTGGGDYPECYEWVLRQVRGLPWSPGAQCSLVMIGDAVPHEPDYHLNTDRLDWRQEARALHATNGVRIYSVQCNSNPGAAEFWQELATLTGGHYLKLDKISSIVDLLMAICYRERGDDHFEAFVSEVHTRDGPALGGHHLDLAFNALRAPGATATPPFAFDFSTGAARPGTSKGAEKTVASRRKAKSTTAKVSLKGRPNTKTAAKKATKIDETKQDNKRGNLNRVNKEKSKNKTSMQGRQLRECLPPKKFILRKLKWSKWELCMKPSNNAADPKWIPNRSGQPGYRNMELFKKNFSRPAVYEFAVQKAPRCKKHVVYNVVRKAFSNKRWDTFLLKRDGRDKVFRMYSGALALGHSIFIRRAVLPKSHTVKDPLLGKVALRSVRGFQKVLSRNYDYAWKRNCRNGRVDACDQRTVKSRRVFYSWTESTRPSSVTKLYTDMGW